MKFGRLTAKYSTEKRDSKSSVYWHCICECGNECDVTHDALVYGSTISCGCRRKEIGTEVGNALHRIDGTCVEHLSINRKMREDNTSGFTGIYFKGKKYAVSLGFKRKKFYLGTYKSLDEAIEVREKAEKLVHQGFENAWKIWNQMPIQWKEENPLIFEVSKVNGELIVNTNIKM